MVKNERVPPVEKKSGFNLAVRDRWVLLTKEIFPRAREGGVV